MYRKIRKFNSDIHIFEFNPKEYRVENDFGVRGKLETVSAIKGNSKPDEEVICKINASFFGGNDEWYGAFIRDGLWYGNISSTYLGVIFDKNYKLKLDWIDTLQKAAYWQGNSQWCLGASFSLIIDGKINLTNTSPFPHYKNKEPRTSIGQKANGDMVFVVVDGRSKENAGVTGQELAQVMFDLSCINAINFDGGGSSTMWHNGKVVNKPCNTNNAERPIGTALIVYKKKEGGKSDNMKTVYLASSVQKNNIGVGKYGNEMDRCFELADLLQPLLEYNGIKVYRNTKSMSLWDAINDGNTKKPDIYVSLHTNAKGANVTYEVRGSSVYCYLISGRKTNSQILGECILEELLKFNQKFSNGIMNGVTPKLAEIISTNPTSVICEHIFHDSPKDVELFINNMEKYAEADARGVCKYFGIEYKSPTKEIDNEYKNKYEALLAELKTLVNKYNV